MILENNKMKNRNISFLFWHFYVINLLCISQSTVLYVLFIKTIKTCTLSLQCSLHFVASYDSNF